MKPDVEKLSGEEMDKRPVWMSPDIFDDEGVRRIADYAKCTAEDVVRVALICWHHYAHRIWFHAQKPDRAELTAAFSYRGWMIIGLCWDTGMNGDTLADVLVGLAEEGWLVDVSDEGAEEERLVPFSEHLHPPGSPGPAPEQLIACPDPNYDAAFERRLAPSRPAQGAER